jgi:hypothetical protein
MQEDQFDRFFRERVEQYPSGVPEDMWERVREGRRRRVGWIWYWVGLGLLLTVGAAGYLMLRGHTGAETFQAKPTTNIARGSSVGRPPERLAPGSTPGRLVPAGAPSRLTPVVTPGQGRTVGRSVNEIRVDKTLGDICERTYHGPASNMIKRAHHGTASNEIERVTASSLTGRTNHEMRTSANDSAWFALVQPTTRLYIQQPGNLLPIPFPSALLLAHLRVVVPYTQPKRKTVEPPDRWYLDVTLSPFWPTSRFASPDFYLLRYAKEQRTLTGSYAPGITLSKSIGKRFSGTVGLQYSTVNMHLGYDSAFTSGGSTIAGHLGRIEVPLLIGYRFIDRYVLTTARVGLMTNVYSWFKENGDTFIDDAYKKTGVGMYLGLNLSPQIGHRVLFSIEPYYQYQLTNMVKNGQPFTERIDMAGVSLGIRYRLWR